MKTFLTALMVWTTLAVAQASLILALGTGKAPATGVIALYIAQAITWAAITVMVLRVSRCVERMPIRAGALAVHILAALAAAVADAVVRRAIADLMLSGNAVSFFHTLLFFADTSVLSYVLAVWLGKAVEARDALIAQTQRELALRTQLARARLGYLQAQLQPHFLFNALGAVTELIFENPAAAVRIFGQLGSVLRASSTEDGEIRLRDEVEALLPYLDVQRTRFSDWLTISLDVAPDAEDLLVPPLVLQPLVENSIRHGLKERTAAGAISIRAERNGGKLALTVRDNGAGLAHSSRVRGLGVGLSNTAERLRTLYGQDASLRLYRNDAGATVAEVLLPSRSAQAHDVAEAHTDEHTVLRISSPVGLVRRHPMFALALGSVLAAVLWTQQSYAYLAISGRLGNKSPLDLARADFPFVLLWSAIVPLCVWAARRLPIAGRHPWRNSALHAGLAFALSALHSVGVVLSRGDLLATAFVPTFRGSATLSLLVYIAALAYSQRRLLEEWFAERQLAAFRTSTEIAESRVAAASLSIDAESLDAAAVALEGHVWSDPMKAEQIVADLGNHLRSRLEAAMDRDSASLKAACREDGVERLAVGA
ncbi:MAG: histidine kinase [Gemmatimonadaceae bacterium]